MPSSGTNLMQGEDQVEREKEALKSQILANKIVLDQLKTVKSQKVLSRSLACGHIYFEEPLGNAVISVRGDVGRSPRMCNHAQMLSDTKHVFLVGYCDSTPHQTIISNENISLVPLTPPPDALTKLPESVQLPIKLIWAFFTLLVALLFRTSFRGLELILMQNPPALPTMLACYLASLINSARFVIDWHNYMYSILRDKYNIPDDEIGTGSSMRHRIVRVVSNLEMACGKLADGSLCVTKSMKKDLESRHGIRANVFYDRPPTWKFGDVTIEDVDQLCRKLSDDGLDVLKSKDGSGDTRLTAVDEQGSIVKSATRPLVLISCTSWTPDEHFDLLLDAAVKYNAVKSHGPARLPDLLVIITGKGPLKEFYLQEISKLQMEHVQFITPWLEAADYPVAIAAADVGVSLHISTSGLDLPMKVVDMFGVRKPVFAKRFNCIGELVKEDENGHLFDTSADLFELILKVAKGFPDSKSLKSLEEYFQKNEFESWETMWNSSAKPFLLPTE